MKSMSEGFPAGKPFCCPEVVTNSLEKVIIRYLVHETIKQTEADIMVKNNTETDEKSISVILFCADDEGRRMNFLTGTMC